MNGGLSQMNNFEYHNTTHIIFGQDTIARIEDLIPKESKILIAYGGGSIFKNGVMDQVKKALHEHEVVEFSGIEPNPDYETLLKAIEFSKAENVDYILAVGGGSVIDGAKFIAAGIPFKGSDYWDIIRKRGQNVNEATPMGCILTLPATGTETNMNSVVSWRNKGLKAPFFSPHTRPIFAILDPQTTTTLPEIQTINGIVDAYVHILEQYLVSRKDTPIQDHQAEGLLRVLGECGLELLKNPSDYNLRAQIMYAATLALNGQLGLGVAQDWATHALGHELTAKYGYDHGATLSMILPSLLRIRLHMKEEKLKIYGKEVFHMENPTAEDVIQRLEKLFTDLKTPIHIPGNISETEVDELVANLTFQNPQALGEDGAIDAKMAKEIYLLASQS